MDLFKMLKEAQKLQGTMNKAKKEIQKLQLDVEKDGIKVSINGLFKITSFAINDTNLLKDKSKLEKSVIACLNEAFELMQEASQKKMQELMKDVPINELGPFLT
ncbi:MAG TPA: YbaB/EbfC family nucleoid-associated protein [Candidatus Hydrothermia bacterium]|nr:YbaB/EbfC family nucleoid-associated protein [Candidatus Hydrothermae bacterium]MDD3649722.1 YbaB/EbfC family nucleoid-associated protein [Candidatus Hydrothermia bacterium]MDD5572667.1 YbaB/EbfC family nucleoid-associated protein [Candidatus Hydrothermia bacterium]HOK23656.1 YbaB/EbfC family nucleoid-associated protein [Candidatus Hydrothermia bacterium]HOL24363.1 YbaB/EbfC family nucleoid-associated protein [Candidatus Hydrothermia bacterium]